MFLRLTALSAVTVLSLSACGDGDEEATAEAADTASTVPAETDDDITGKTADGKREGLPPAETVVEAEGLTYTIPAGWEEVNVVPGPMEIDTEPVLHGLRDAERDIIAYTSVTRAEKSSPDGPVSTAADTAAFLPAFFDERFIGLEFRGSEPYEVPGSVEAARSDLRYSQAHYGTTLVVDTGEDDFVLLHAVIWDFDDPSEDEVSADDLEVILASVTVE